MTDTKRVRVSSVVRASFLALVALVAAGAQAQPYFDPSGLFPSPKYVQQDPLIMPFTSGWLIRGMSFTVGSGRIVPPGSGFLISNFTFTSDFDLSPPGGPFTSESGSGNGMAKIQFDHVSGTTEFYTTELLALNLTSGPALVRESPTMASFGGFSRTPSGGGWQVDSFFDVFTELSLDGGQSWVPSSQGATHFGGTPEPCTLLVLGAGAALLRLRKKRKNN